MIRQPFTNRRPLDPRRCNVAIDANALNRDGSTHDALVARLLDLYAAGTIRLMLPKGVREEIQDLRTPAHIRAATTPMIFSYSLGLNSEEQRKRRLIEQELQGNAKPGKHAADADHLFEAAKYGGYFVTHDQRILGRSSNMRNLLPPSLNVVTLAGFLEIFDDYETGRLI
jgi:hypothetical protein